MITKEQFDAFIEAQRVYLELKAPIQERIHDIANLVQTKIDDLFNPEGYYLDSFWFREDMCSAELLEKDPQDGYQNQEFVSFKTELLYKESNELDLIKAEIDRKKAEREAFLEKARAELEAFEETKEKELLARLQAKYGAK